MAIPDTSKPTYPDVPLSPGVPAVPRQLPVIQSNIVLLAADAASVASLFSGSQWGLFLNGSPAFSSVPGLTGALGNVISVVAQSLGASSLSVGQLDYRLDYRISTAPQEEGAFLSYNKVSTPYQAKVTYIVGGISAARGAFLTALEKWQASLTLLSLVMPEKTYTNCNIVHSDYRRSARNGVSMLMVDIWVEEVRPTGTVAFSNTETPAGADQVNGGTVTAQPATPAQTPPTGITTDPPPFNGA